MAKAKLKTSRNESSVTDFLDSVADPQIRKAADAVLELMKKVTKAAPKMWGASIIGFGEVHLKYETGRELDWFKVGFSPRKQNLTLYLTRGFAGCEELLQKLGKHKLGKGCLYIKRVEDVHLPTLKALIERSVVV